MANLYEASDQWAKRPADERYWNLDEMLGTARKHHQSAEEARVNLAQLKLAGRADNSLCLVDQQENMADLTNWSFKQLARRVAAPAGYLESLPSPIAAMALTHGLQKLGDDGGSCNVLVHNNGRYVCRSFMSDSYARIWNDEVIERLLVCRANGWRVPPARPAMENQPGARPATEADILNQKDFWGQIKVGQMIAPAGLYCSDHDMFAFMVNDEVRIDDGTDGGLARGFFISNSEVGAAALKVTRFMYAYICSNHIVWDVKDVEELKIIHVGRNAERFSWRVEQSLKSYAQESTAGDVARIKAAKNLVLGSNKEEVIDVLFKEKSIGMTKQSLEAAYVQAEIEYAEKRSSGIPRSAWGFAQGVTAMSQKTTFTDDRVALDRAAGRIMGLA